MRTLSGTLLREQQLFKVCFSIHLRFLTSGAMPKTLFKLFSAEEYLTMPHSYRDSCLRKVRDMVTPGRFKNSQQAQRKASWFPFAIGTQSGESKDKTCHRLSLEKSPDSPHHQDIKYKLTHLPATHK